MSLDSRQADSPPVTTPEQLVATFRSAEKPRAGYRVGLEHEKQLVDTRGWGPVPYEGPRGVGALLSRLEQEGHTPFREHPGAPTIALQRGALTVSLEPGGQLELSGSAVRTARDAAAENRQHLEEVRRATEALGLLPVALGYRPFGAVAEMPWMPKTRYQTMRSSMGPRGALALDMMLMTATGQVSLDWSDEADCARKVNVSARAAPLLVALYANSPLVGGKPCGRMSFRSHVWTAVDPARCGTPAAMLDGTFSYRAYVEWALDAPLLFLRRHGQYLTPKLTFRQLLAQGYDGEPARDSDWVDHLSTLFPEVRLKRVLEIRSADGVGEAMTAALPALYRGLLYDPGALADADQALPRFTAASHAEWMDAARTHGLAARVGKESLLDRTKALLQVARAGLQRLDPADVPLLGPLEAQAASGRSPAEAVLETFAEGGGPERLYRRFAL